MTEGLPPISSSCRQTPWDPRPVFVSTKHLNSCDYNPYLTSCLTRGWGCRLQLLLTLVRAVILGFQSRGTHDHILLSQTRDSPLVQSLSQWLWFIPSLCNPTWTASNNLLCCCACIHCRGNAFIELLPRNGPCSRVTISKKAVTYRLGESRIFGRHESCRSEQA
jgi:hypothetical protein